MLQQRESNEQLRAKIIYFILLIVYNAGVEKYCTDNVVYLNAHAMQSTPLLSDNKVTNIIIIYKSLAIVGGCVNGEVI